MLFTVLESYILISRIGAINFCNKGANVIRSVLIISLSFLQPLSIANSYAGTLPIEVDGTTNTQIDAAANFVPIVNIAAPNSGGLSHNKFNSYNVNPSGLVINNATNNPNQVVQTNIGGLITDNPNLAGSGSARVILNEVTSTNKSLLNGYTEIGGRQADLIIANPNGIEMNSAGFINVSRLTAIVGSAKGFNPHPNDLSFNLNGNKNSDNGFLPKLTISGLGLDVARVTKTDLVANIMEIVSPIYGGTNIVNLRAGNKEFNYNTKEVTSDNTNPGTNQPDEVAIDASNIAKIQAGQIYMIATVEGFGVKYTGDMLASRSGVTIDAKGNIVYNNIASQSGGISVKTTNGDVTGSGITHNKDINSDIAIEASGNINNQGQLLSARDINVTAGNTFNNTGTEINLSDRNFTIDANQVNNLGNLSAVNNLSLTADILNNSKEIIANNDITITGSGITNSNSIIAGNKLNITATDFLTNNNDILSLVSGASDDSLIINTRTLNNNKRIAANSAITINSNSLNNNNAYSLILSGKDANLNITNLNNNLGNIESKNNLKIRNLASNNADAALLLSVSDTSTNISNSGTLKATNSIDINLGFSDYEIIGKLETDGFINIEANNITNKADIGAVNYIKLTSANYFTNGINGGDNSNIKIASNTSLDIAANNNINNYSTLSAKTILSLKSLNGNINNYNGAELLASNQNNPGTSKLILEAINGAINQYSPNSVVVNGNHTITAEDYTNIGRIDIAGSLTMNIANNLINDIGALIYAGSNMFLNVVNNLTNKTNATIYAENDLFITNRALTTTEQATLSALKSEIAATSDNTIIKQKRLEIANIFDNLKINKLANISGNIESYGGDIYLASATLTNKREYLPEQSEEVQVYFNNQPVKHGNIHHYYYRSNTQGDRAPIGLINSTNNLTINASAITNNSASIYAGNDIVLKANSVNNVSNMYRDYVRYRRNDHNTTFGASTYWYTGTTNVNGINYVNRAHTITGNIKAGGNFVGYSTGDIGNGTTEHTAANFICTHHHLSYTCHNRVEIPTGTAATAGVVDVVAEQSSAILSVTDKNAQIINGVDIGNLLDTGKVEKDLSNYINGPETSGMFQKSTNPNTPLFETRSQFVDNGKFFGSDYFYQKIGLNLTDVQTEFEQQNKRLVGDQFFQAKIIEEQLKTIRKNALLLSDSGTNANTETQSLLDNAADEYTRLGLTANETLTQTQIDSLEKDIVWFETETINGELYVVPKIYLTKATRDSLNNNDSLTTKSTIMAMGDLQLNSDSLSNSGSIVGNNVAISTTNDITNNNFSDIIATNGLNLTSNSGSIINFSKLKAGGAVSLTAANNITNTSTVKTNAANLLDSDNLAYISNGSAASNSGNISSTLIETALIEAGSFTANAGNDFSNYGADITTTGDTSISAGNNVNIEAVQLRDRSEQRWGNKKKGGVKITDTTTNIGSNINIGGNLVLASTNDTLIKGSDISVDGNATINTAGDLNIVSATDSYYAFESSHKKGSFGRRSSSSSTVNKTTNIESNINVAGDINSNSQENINIIASNLTSGGNINLNATKAVNILAGQDASYSKTQRNKKGTTIIKSSADIAYDITNVHSNLNATGNIALTSGTNTNLVGANLDAGNNIDVNAGDELMIAAVADESYRYSDSTKTRSMATIAKYTGISATLKTYGALADSADFISKPLEGAGLNVGATIVSGVVNYAQNLAEGDVNSKTKSNVTKTKNYQLSKLDAKNNLNITSNNNINLIGVDINTVNDTIITSNNGDINIANVKDSYYNKNETKKSKTTFTSLATDLVKTPLLIVSSVVSGYNMLQHPDKKKQTLEDNKTAMKNWKLEIHYQ